MIITEKVESMLEEMAGMEVQNFIIEGLKDVQEGNLYDFNEVFEEIEGRYRNA